jgi:hypothetical protein
VSCLPDGAEIPCLEREDDVPGDRGHGEITIARVAFADITTFASRWSWQIGRSMPVKLVAVTA